MKVVKTSLLSALLLSTLAACGGGGGGGGGGGVPLLGATGTAAATATTAASSSGTATDAATAAAIDQRLGTSTASNAAAAAAAATGTAGTTTTAAAAATGTTAGTSTPTVTGTTPATTTFCATQANDIVDTNLNIVPSSYTAMAAQMSKDAGIAYRYGPDSASCGATNTGLALFKRGDTKLGPPAANEAFYWQVGSPTGNAGSYSTNQANMVFVADNPAVNVGVTDFQVTGYMYNVFAQLPQLSWTTTIAPGGGLDSLNVLAYKSAGTVNGDPVAIGRCSGRPGFCGESLVAFQNGVIATAGSNTASNDVTVKLAANKVPTAIAMTNDSEFALVTVWDTAALKGQVAVIALAGLCDGCGITNGTPRAWYDWWHEWLGVYPGLPNMGNIGFMKILGYVDIPGMAAPTEIAVTTGLDQFSTILVGGNFMGLDNSPLTSNWQKFASGGTYYNKYAKGGMAVVISKSEQKAAFIDLKPLFNQVNNGYFSSGVAATSNIGQADGQWPYSFANTPSQTPTVVKTVALGARPTAVRTNVSGTGRAWIATQDGNLRIFSLGGYAPGGAPQSPASSAIAELGTVGGIGRNPTSIATSKGEPGASFEPINEQVIVASRGDRKISWVHFTGNGGTITRSFQHNLLVDPIGVEDSDNFANASYVLSVADYAGKAVRNYRYGPIIFADGGSCPSSNPCQVIGTGGTAVEYGGAMALPGKPFQVSTANVP